MYVFKLFPCFCGDISYLPPDLRTNCSLRYFVVAYITWPFCAQFTSSRNGAPLKLWASMPVCKYYIHAHTKNAKNIADSVKKAKTFLKHTNRTLQSIEQTDWARKRNKKDSLHYISLRKKNKPKKKLSFIESAVIQNICMRFFSFTVQLDVCSPTPCLCWHSLYVHVVGDMDVFAGNLWPNCIYKPLYGATTAGVSAETSKQLFSPGAPPSRRSTCNPAGYDWCCDGVG